MITGFPSALMSTEKEILYEDGVAEIFNGDVHDFNAGLINWCLDTFNTTDATLKIWTSIYTFYTDMYYQASFIFMMPINLFMFSFAIGNWRMDEK